MPVPDPDGTIRRKEMPEVFPSHPILRPGDEGYIEPAPTPEPAPEAPSNGFVVAGPNSVTEAPAAKEPGHRNVRALLRYPAPNS